MRAAVLAFASVALLSGCGTLSPRLSLGDEPPPPLPPALPPTAAAGGSIWADGGGLALFEDAKARNVGDLVTILLVESTTAQKKAGTNTSKASSVDIGDTKVLGKPVTTLSGVGGKRSFAGSGDSSQSNSLAGSLTAVVVARLPNGLLQVRGEKQIELNQGAERIVVDGLVRGIDIRPDNSVTSDRIANARVSYRGRGALADANAQGWLSRFFDSPWFPF